MFTRLKKGWSELKRGRPGSRFQDQHDKQRSQKKSTIGRVLRIAAAVLLVPIGMFFLAVPGPGLLFIGLGAVLLAREFRFAAVALDWLEVRGRKIHKWGKQRWQRLARARREVTR